MIILISRTHSRQHIYSRQQNISVDSSSSAKHDQIHQQSRRDGARGITNSISSKYHELCRQIVAFHFVKYDN